MATHSKPHSKPRSKSHSHTSHPHKNKKSDFNSDVAHGEGASAGVNRQNSDLSSSAHPSGGRIEGMYRDVRLGEPDNVEIRRPSERENRYSPPEEPAEGARDDSDQQLDR